MSGSWPRGSIARSDRSETELRARTLVAGLMLAALVAPGWTVAPAAPVRAVALGAGLHACPSIQHARCGRIEVPLDPRAPELGTTSVGFVLYPRRRADRPSLGTIVAVEGGPGYSTIASRWWYRDLYRPLLGRRQLLLVDLRGTGRSDPIDCPDLQSYVGAWKRNVARCGRQLGPLAERYGSAFAADDLAAVLDALDVGRVDLYGDSYGTFFAQTFAVRHPDRVRTVTLDGAYPIDATDPWWRDTNRAIVEAFTRLCDRDPACRAHAGDPIARIARLAARLRVHPLRGRAPDADGRAHDVRLSAGTLVGLAAGAATSQTIYRELDAAVRAALRPRHPDPFPLMRLAAENEWHWGGGDIHVYSEGLATATSCNDYPQVWDIHAPLDERPAQYRQALADLRRDDPHAFAPFTIDDWVRAYSSDVTSCIRWPVPDDHVPAMPPGGSYPDVPVLVLDGEFDSLTSPEGAQGVADRFPDATFVEVANSLHVTALGDVRGCVERLALDFVRSTRVGDAACADRYPPVRMAVAFPRAAAGLGPPSARRTALVASRTVGDVLARWWSMASTDGVGLRGGRFRTGGYRTPSFHLHRVRWVGDVAVSGVVRWDRPSGRVHATVRLAGAGTRPAALELGWNAWRPGVPVTVTGSVAGRPVTMTVPVP
jgi:pimeloyl-ACP methyl ester carboxylesterase